MAVLVSGSAGSGGGKGGVVSSKRMPFRLRMVGAARYEVAGGIRGCDVIWRRRACSIPGWPPESSRAAVVRSVCARAAVALDARVERSPRRTCARRRVAAAGSIARMPGRASLAGPRDGAACDLGAVKGCRRAVATARQGTWPRPGDNGEPVAVPRGRAVRGSHGEALRGAAMGGLGSRCTPSGRWARTRWVLPGCRFRRAASGRSRREGLWPARVAPLRTIWPRPSPGGGGSASCRPVAAVFTATCTQVAESPIIPLLSAPDGGQIQE